MEEAAAVQVRSEFRRHFAAAGDQRAVAADGQPRDVHHGWCRPASDVDGAVLQVSAAKDIVVVEWAGDDGFWPAGGDGRAGGASGCAGGRYRRRRQLSDEYSGDGDVLLREAASEGAAP